MKNGGSYVRDLEKSEYRTDTWITPSCGSLTYSYPRLPPTEAQFRKKKKKKFACSGNVLYFCASNM